MGKTPFLPLPAPAIFLLIGCLLSSCRPEAPSGKSITGEASRQDTSQKRPGPVLYRLDTTELSRNCAAGEKGANPCVGLSWMDLRVIDSCSYATELESYYQKVSRSGLYPTEGDYASLATYADSMQAQVQEIYEPPYHQWYVNQEAQIDLNRAGLFGFHFSLDQFQGGAHSSYSIRCVLLQLPQVHPLKLEELLVPELRSTFGRLAEEKFRERYSLSPEEDLEEAGYWFESNRFHLPANFRLYPQGLELIYNPYEVAPFSEGVLRLHFSRARLRPFLRERYWPALMGN